MSHGLSGEPARHYAELAEIAVLKEQSGDWGEASRYWTRAEEVARLPVNRLWAGHGPDIVTMRPRHYRT